MFCSKDDANWICYQETLLQVMKNAISKIASKVGYVLVGFPTTTQLVQMFESLVRVSSFSQPLTQGRFLSRYKMQLKFSLNLSDKTKDSWNFFCKILQDSALFLQKIVRILQEMQESFWNVYKILPTCSIFSQKVSVK